MVRPQILGACLLVAASAAARDAPAVPTDRPERLPTAPGTTAFTLQDNLIRIDTRVNGRSVSAVLDSGVGALILDQAVIRRLGLTAAGEAVDAAGAGTTATALRPVMLSDLRVGPLRFRNIASYSGDLSQLTRSARFPVDLLVGAPAFKYGAVTIDYPRRRITFGPSGSTAPCAVPIPLEIIHDAPVVVVEFRPTPGAPPVRLKLLVDLGTRHLAVAIGGPFLRTAAGQALSRSGVPRQVGHGIGGKVQGVLAHVSALRIGRADFGDVDVALSPDVPAFDAGFVDGTLGVPLWQAGLISFDYPARRLCITIPEQR